MSKPRLIDLYCCAGGCSVGYHRAGFEVVGVDIMLQPHYPYKFIQMNALEFLERYLSGEYPEADAFSASPPCQKYTKSAMQWRLAGKEYPDLIAATRSLLIATGKPQYAALSVPLGCTTSAKGMGRTIGHNHADKNTVLHSCPNA